MLGTFQKSQLRIEIDASATAIRNSLLRAEQMEKWQISRGFTPGMPEELYSGFEFTTRTGPVAIHHQVDLVGSNSLRLLLSQGIDGFHEWYWGEGWLQSRIEGVTIIPLALSHSLSLLSLRSFFTGVRRQESGVRS